MARREIRDAYIVLTAHSEAGKSEYVMRDGLTRPCGVLCSSGRSGIYPIQQLAGLPRAFLPDKTAHSFIECWCCEFSMPLPVITVEL